MIKYIKRFLVVSMLSLLILPAHAAMVSSSELHAATPAYPPADFSAQQQHVLQQLIEHGVDRETAIERVHKLDPQQLAELQVEIENLPAGAGISTTNLLLIIILLVLLL